MRPTDRDALDELFADPRFIDLTKTDYDNAEERWLVRLSILGPANLPLGITAPTWEKAVQQAVEALSDETLIVRKAAQR